MNNNHFCQLLLITLLACGLPVASAQMAAAEERPLPRPGSLKRAVTNVRAGPGAQYPILWVFKRKGWPVEVLARYQNWYRIRDVEGEEGWVYASLVSGQNTAVTRGQNRKNTYTVLYRRADAERPVLQFEDGVVVDVDTCSPYMCKVEYRNYKGWVFKDQLDIPASAAVAKE